MRTSGKNRNGFLMIALVLAFAASSFASVSSQYSFHNAIETSAVNIDLKQISQDENGKEKNVYCGTVGPGMLVSYIPRIQNKGTKCYVRVSASFEMENGDSAGLSLDDIRNLGKDWARIGKYLYCEKPLDIKESTDAFSGIQIPREWSGSGDSTLNIIVSADAIQAKNFSPDFQKENPWGSVAIENSGSRVSGADSVPVRKVVSANNIDITYTDSKTFECSTEDLFSDFHTLLPGDSCRRSLPVKNNSRRSMSVYFRTDNVDSDLLDVMKLTISCKGRDIYRGSLASRELSEFQKVVTIPAGGQSRLDFAISLPKQAGNRYEELSDQVTWILAVKETGRGDSSQAFVKTGDLVGAALIVLFMICTLMAIIIIIVLLKGRRQ